MIGKFTQNRYDRKWVKKSLYELKSPEAYRKQLKAEIGKNDWGIYPKLV
jgi:hypothetical protein